jgi:D-beta-D-heptose 7-phosphate kinase/D-beta-D-heptose 1-phosphate adenosyltransferase
VNFSKIKIVVVGDIMLDRYVWGKVRRISPEAPVPVVKVQRISQTLGGAGNVANNLSALGCKVTVIGVCGSDDKAETLRQRLSEKNIHHCLIEDTTRPTITKTRIMADKQQMMRLDEEVVNSPPDNIFSQVKDLLTEAIKGGDAVILSDYGKGLLTRPDMTQELIRMVRDHHLPVLVDPKGGQWDRYQNAAGITPNISELEVAAGVSLDKDEGKLIDQAKKIRRQYGLEWLLVTQGAQGMCLVGPNSDVTAISARALEVYDVSGAGDTVVATMAVALAGGAGFEEAARIANTAAGIVVGKLGTQPILQSELIAALEFEETHRNYPFSAVKTAAKDAASAKVGQWRTAGDKVVFTNGCFDLLHPGHVSLLYQARALGDRLVVGLNTDASVRRLKGPQRPKLAQQDRAAILSALACVDMVVHFDEDTPLDLIGALKPDILVKGSDYKPEEVVGKELVASYGGSVKLVDIIEGYSTTRLVGKMPSD